MASNRLVIGTRGSKLALVQAEYIRQLLLAMHPQLQVELSIIQTQGDRILDRPLAAIGDKGLFIKEIEAALLAGAIDIAVHSAKDLPSLTPPELVLAAFPLRADPRDGLISNTSLNITALPHGACVGTSSLRRECQLRALRPDLRIELLRGNVDTRLRRLDEGQYDAIVLAVAGLQRLELQARISEPIEPAVMLPAVAQGALAVQCRADNQRSLALLKPLDHPATRQAILAERAFLRRLEGGCQVPIAAYAQLNAAGDRLNLQGLIGLPDGSQIVRGEQFAVVSEAEALGTALAEELLERGGRRILAAIGALE